MDRRAALRLGAVGLLLVAGCGGGDDDRRSDVAGVETQGGVPPGTTQADDQDAAVLADLAGREYELTRAYMAAIAFSTDPFSSDGRTFPAAATAHGERAEQYVSLLGPDGRDTAPTTTGPAAADLADARSALTTLEQGLLGAAIGAAGRLVSPDAVRLAAGSAVGAAEGLAVLRAGLPEGGFPDALPAG